MFAKIAKFQGARQAAPLSAVLTHSNDNARIAHPAATRHRSAEPTLACHWRPTIGGGLECYWVVEPADGAATEEPYQCWMAVCGPLGFPVAA